MFYSKSKTNKVLLFLSENIIISYYFLRKLNKNYIYNK